MTSSAEDLLTGMHHRRRTLDVRCGMWKGLADRVNVNVETSIVSGNIRIYADIHGILWRGSVNIRQWRAYIRCVYNKSAGLAGVGFGNYGGEKYNRATTKRIVNALFPCGSWASCQAYTIRRDVISLVLKKVSSDWRENVVVNFL